MNQCLLIHGGEPFGSDQDFFDALQTRTYDPNKPERLKRRDWLKHAISHEYQVLTPEMPNKYNARYEAWRIWFEKTLPYIDEDRLVLIGYSLGGLFLCKWLCENVFPRKISQLHLVATPVVGDGMGKAGLVDFAYDQTKLAHLAQQCEEIFIYHSRDDEVVPYTQAEILTSFLPTAELLTFETRNHFFQPAFPELLEKMRVYSR